MKAAKKTIEDILDSIPGNREIINSGDDVVLLKSGSSVRVFYMPSEYSRKLQVAVDRHNEASRKKIGIKITQIEGLFLELLEQIDEEKTCLGLSHA